MTKEVLRAKAKGLSASFSKMTAKQRDSSLSSTIVADYNKLRETVLALMPDPTDVMPPKITLHKDTPLDGLEEFATYAYDAHYQDLHAYSEQIVNFLSLGDDKLVRTRLAR